MHQTLELSKEQILELQKQLQNHPQVAPPQYALFRIKSQGVTITGYQSGKLLFQGPNAPALAQAWSKKLGLDPQMEVLAQETSPRRAKPSQVDYNRLIHIGSDEVGNGSYFGALTVCAVYVNLQQIALLKELGVQDSKNLSDTSIKNLAWQIKASVPYHLTICNPPQYNRANQKMNANAIKAVLHNFTLIKLWQKLDSDQQAALQMTLMDQFAPEKTYAKYLQNEAHHYPNPITFQKKAESQSVAVAAASILARDAFLASLDKLGKPFGLVLPSGASPNVDQIGKQLVKAHGKQVLGQVAKLHFANTEKILGQSNKG
ncbi:TPA: ribonuclease HIII [Streptococcus suis]